MYYAATRSGVAKDLKAVVSELFDVEYLKISETQLVQVASCCMLMS